MEPVPGKDAASRVTSMISPKHQVHGYTVSLTVREIYSIDPVGQVDFGGGEYRAAGRQPLAPLQRAREDKYKWWELDRGSYFVEFNETLELGPDEMALLEPDERLLRAGAAHTPVFLRGRVSPVEALVHVQSLRMSIKQNARISRVRVFRFSNLLPSAVPAAAPEMKKLKRVKKKK
jgi:deoxycytidine triphosphate deaminase